MNTFFTRFLFVCICCTSGAIHSQCLTINCVPDTTIGTDTVGCGAIYNYTVTATSNCFMDSAVFNFTGAQQTWIVPAGVTSITVDILGAAGGGEVIIGPPGLGGRLQATYPVTPGETLFVYVGGMGDVTGTPGYNGGGSGIGGSPGSPGSGGGGASDIRIGGTSLNDRVLVAGGGGGGTENGGTAQGGAGGGMIGADGACGGNPWSCTPLTLATGGTQVAGGLGGTSTSCAWNGFNGTFGVGGNSHNNYRSAGGGGGWYGGGGAHNGCAGAGGSSYADPSATSVLHTQGYNNAHGMVKIYYGSGTYTLSQLAGLPSGATFPVGTTTNVFMVADSSGNSDTCSFQVTVTDTQDPFVSVPADVSTCDSVVSNITVLSGDNCSAVTISWYTTGATVTSGTGSINGTLFAVGTTTVWYVVEDGAGNMDSASFDIIVNPTPVVTLNPFSTDTLCVNYGAVALPSGTPPSGIYSGSGISGSNFDPSLSGAGNFWINYSFTTVDGCENSDSTMITVLGCAGINDWEEQINVYPNPSNGIFILELVKPVKMTITNALGTVVLIREVNAGISQWDLSGNAAGIYYMILEHDNQVVTRSVIVQK